MNKGSNNEPMTLDTLAEIINSSFEANAKDIKALDGKVDTLDSKVDALDSKVGALEYKVEEEFRLVKEQIKALNFAVEIDDLRTRVRNIEVQLKITHS